MQQPGFFRVLHQYMANGGPNPFALILFVIFMTVLIIAMLDL